MQYVRQFEIARKAAVESSDLRLAVATCFHPIGFLGFIRGLADAKRQGRRPAWAEREGTWENWLRQGAGEAAIMLDESNTHYADDDDIEGFVDCYMSVKELRFALDNLLEIVQDPCIENYTIECIVITSVLHLINDSIGKHERVCDELSRFAAMRQ